MMQFVYDTDICAAQRKTTVIVESMYSFRCLLKVQQDLRAEPGGPELQIRRICSWLTLQTCPSSYLAVCSHKNIQADKLTLLNVNEHMIPLVEQIVAKVFRQVTGAAFSLSRLAAVAVTLRTSVRGRNYDQMRASVRSLRSNIAIVPFSSSRPQLIHARPVRHAFVKLVSIFALWMLRDRVSNAQGSRYWRANIAGQTMSHLERRAHVRIHSLPWSKNAITRGSSVIFVRATPLCAVRHFCTKRGP